jgi:hypothetical protein
VSEPHHKEITVVMRAEVVLQEGDSLIYRPEFVVTNEEKKKLRYYDKKCELVSFEKNRSSDESGNLRVLVRFEDGYQFCGRHIDIAHFVACKK